MDGEVADSSSGDLVENERRSNTAKKNWTRGENITRWVHWRARNDMVRMTVKGSVNPAKNVQKVFDDNWILETLKYILIDMNCQPMSWGTTHIKINGEKEIFPLLVRKVEIEVMWRNYSSDEHAFADGTKKVGRTLFCRIVSRITKGDIK